MFDVIVYPSFGLLPPSFAHPLHLSIFFSSYPTFGSTWAYAQRGGEGICSMRAARARTVFKADRLGSMFDVD